MSPQATLTPEGNNDKEDNESPPLCDVTQIKISDLEVLVNESNAVIDRRNVPPYVAGEYDNATPLSAVRPIGEILNGFDLDPCASENSQLASLNIRHTGGLRYDWTNHDTVWCNPPYDKGEKVKWLKKAVNAAESGVETVIMLLPANVNAEWFQTYSPHASLIHYPESRVSFHSGGNGASGSVYLVFGEYPPQLYHYFDRNGMVKKQTSPNGAINVDTGDTKNLLLDTGKADQLRLFFEKPVSERNINLTALTVQPIVEYIIPAGEVKYPGVSDTFRSSPETPDGEYYELTCIYRKGGTYKEVFITIYQSVKNPHAVYCYIDTDTGWVEKELSEVHLTTAMEGTHNHLKQADINVKGRAE